MDPLNEEHVEATREMTKALADMVYGHDPIMALIEGASIDEARELRHQQQDANERFHAAAKKVWAIETGEGRSIESYKAPGTFLLDRLQRSDAPQPHDDQHDQDQDEE